MVCNMVSIMHDATKRAAADSRRKAKAKSNCGAPYGRRVDLAGADLKTEEAPNLAFHKGRCCCCNRTILEKITIWEAGLPGAGTPDKPWPHILQRRT
jgi:hypothetical protein